MERVTANYSAKWQIIDRPNYKWTVCKKLINTCTGREIKKTLKGMTPGYWIGRDFVPLSKMKDMVEVIKHEKLPF